MGEGNKRLSKRDKGSGLAEYIERGFLPEGLLNYLALLGWAIADDRDIFSMDGDGEAFDIRRVNPNPARFDLKKCEAINAAHIARCRPTELAERIVPFLQRAGLVGDEPTDDERRAARRPRRWSRSGSTTLGRGRRHGRLPVRRRGRLRHRSRRRAAKLLDAERAGAVGRGVVRRLSGARPTLATAGHRGSAARRARRRPRVCKPRNAFGPVRVAVDRAADLPAAVRVARAARARRGPSAATRQAAASTGLTVPDRRSRPRGRAASTGCSRPTVVAPGGGCSSASVLGVGWCLVDVACVRRSPSGAGHAARHTHGFRLDPTTASTPVRCWRPTSGLALLHPAGRGCCSAVCYRVRPRWLARSNRPGRWRWLPGLVAAGVAAVVWCAAVLVLARSGPPDIAAHRPGEGSSGSWSSCCSPRRCRRLARRTCSVACCCSRSGATRLRRGPCCLASGACSRWPTASSHRRCSPTGWLLGTVLAFAGCRTGGLEAGIAIHAVKNIAVLVPAGLFGSVGDALDPHGVTWVPLLVDAVLLALAVPWIRRGLVAASPCRALRVRRRTLTRRRVAARRGADPAGRVRRTSVRFGRRQGDGYGAA